MKRTVLLFAALTMLLAVPCAGRAAAGTGIKATPPLWVHSIEEARKHTKINKPMYIYFALDDDKAEMPKQFVYNVGMYNISRKDAVFVLLKIPKKPSDEEKELLKKYGVRRMGTAVLADKDGNLLGSAEVRSPNALLRQIRKIRVTIEEIAKDIFERTEKGKEAVQAGNMDVARIHFQSVIRKYPTYDEAKTAQEYIDKIDNPGGEKKEPAGDEKPADKPEDKQGDDPGKKAEGKEKAEKKPEDALDGKPREKPEK